MRVVVLTGGIGSGKSAAAEYLGQRGAFVVDLDDVARSVMAPGSEVLATVAREFGPEVVGADGALDRAVLAQACFASPDATARLDAIVHPVVTQETVALLRSLATRPTPPRVVVLEVPLLAEAPAFADLADVVVALEAPEATRVDRVVARGMERGDATRRVAAQASDEERAALADVVIPNSGTYEELIAAVASLWSERLSDGGDLDG